MDNALHDLINQIRSILQSNIMQTDPVQAERLLNTLTNVESSFDADIRIGGDVSGTLYVARQIVNQSINLNFPPSLPDLLEGVADRLNRFLDSQAQTGTVNALQNAVAALDSHWPIERCKGVQSLNELAVRNPSSGAKAALAAVMEYPFQDVRVYSIFWLARSFRDPHTVPLLERIYYNSPQLYSSLGNEASVLLLETHNLSEFLDRVHPSDLIRYLAILAVGQVGDKQAIALLRVAQNDQWEVIRASATHDLRDAGLLP